MTAQVIELTNNHETACYQEVSDEALSKLVVSSQVLSGSKVSKCHYEQVVFTECLFYATEFQGVMFVNCIFENCNFEFTHIRNCKFLNCNFNHCTWKASSTINTIYEDCDLDISLSRLTEVNGNELSFSFDFQLPIAC